MMLGFRWPKPAILLLFFILSCGKPVPELDHVDTSDWKLDKNGCNGKRAKMIGAFREQKAKLLGLDEMAVIKLLGKPDENTLYKRNQKFYNYFLEPSSACPQPVNDPKKLSIRFNAMGLAREVSIE